MQVKAPNNTLNNKKPRHYFKKFYVTINNRIKSVQFLVKTNFKNTIGYLNSVIVRKAPDYKLS